MALPGPWKTSDLSPQSAPKRTLTIRDFASTRPCLRSCLVLQMGELPSKRAVASTGEAGAYQFRQVMGQAKA